MAKRTDSNTLCVGQYLTVAYWWTGVKGYVLFRESKEIYEDRSEEHSVGVSVHYHVTARVYLAVADKLHAVEPSERVGTIRGEHFNTVLKADNGALGKPQTLAFRKRRIVAQAESFPDVQCVHHADAAHGLFDKCAGIIIDLENLALYFRVCIFLVLFVNKKDREVMNTLQLRSR